MAKTKNKKIKLEIKNKQGHYSLAWNYIKESRKYILFAIVLFVCAVALGMTFQPAGIVEMIKKFIEQLTGDISGLGFWQLWLFILNNNLKSSFIALISGVLFGIFPFLTAVANGYLMGFVADLVIKTGGAGGLWKLAPHGIFELPALFLSIGLGMKLGTFFLCKNMKKEFLRRLSESLRVFLFIVIPLLVIAGVIEAGLIILLG